MLVLLLVLERNVLFMLKAISLNQGINNAAVGLAFIQFTGLVLFKICVIFSIREKIKQWIHKPGLAEDNGNDDWELYEEAALMQKREAEVEREADLGGMAINEIANESVNKSVNSIAVADLEGFPRFPRKPPLRFQTLSFLAWLSLPCSFLRSGGSRWGS